MNAYESKLSARADRLNARAAALSAAADRVYKAGHNRVKDIPFGQPILVGHHSERRHRNDLARYQRAIRRSIELSNAAKYAAAAAARVGSGGISADDPDAMIKLHERVRRLEADQLRMKEVNALIRKHAKKGVDAQIAALVAVGLTDSQARAALKPDFCGRVGFPDYALTNNNANIKRIKQRIASLEHVAACPIAPERWDISGEQCDVVANIEENRLQLLFSGKPSEALRASLKNNGWRWSPMAGAWQRYLHTANMKWLRASLGAAVL